MKDGIKLYLSELKRNKTRRRKLLGVFCVLAIMVAAGVFWRLRIIGITKTAEPTCGIPEHIHSEECILSKTLICGFEDDTVEEQLNGELKLTCSFQPHVHTYDCFDEFGNVICGNADYVIHQHDISCFNESGVLICTLPEVLPHVHTDACYENTTSWSCGYEEGAETAVHTHTDDCYETHSTLICTLAEDDTHTHSPDCYTEEKLLICTLPETEVHIHNESCARTDERKLICGLQEIALHVHTPECYDEMGTLICGQLQTFEHYHTVECMPQSAPQENLPKDDASALPDGITDDGQKPHVHTDECYEIIYKCGYEEHIHAILCYADYNADLETEDDWKSTIPSDAEFDGTRSDYLVEIALSQLDYAESKRNFIIDQQGIRRGYSRYGQWYNNPYGPWNTSFVSFCMHYAGIADDEIPPASGAFQMLTQLDSLGRFVPHTYEDPMGDYEPIPGDIAFIDINGDGMPDRTGIISDVFDDSIEVIEGDVGDNDYILDSSSELYESIGGSAITQLGLLSAEEIYVDEGFELEGMPTDLLLGDAPAFDAAAFMPSEDDYMADIGLYSNDPAADSPVYPTEDPAANPSFGIPKMTEEDVVLDEESFGYVWDDEEIPTHSVAKVSYEKSDSAIVGYGIVSSGEEAELYTSLGGYELYTGDYTDLGSIGSAAVVNVTANKAMILSGNSITSVDFNTTSGSNSALIWSFIAFTGDNKLPQDFRIKLNTANIYVPIHGNDIVINDVIDNSANQEYMSKFFFSKHDNYVLIDSLDGSVNTRTGYYLLLDDDGKFKYEHYDSEDEADADYRTHFQLYVPKQLKYDESEFAHKYELGTYFTQYPNNQYTSLDLPNAANTSNSKVLKLYANPGEKLLIQVSDRDFNANSAGDNFHAVIPNPDIADIDFLGANGSSSVYSVTANREGSTVITLWQENAYEKDWQGNPTNNIGINIMRIELQIGGDISKSFRTGSINPYRHLDVEVEANFKIKIYNENAGPNDEEYITINPTNIRVVDVYSKVYNTGKLYGNVWDTAYMKEPGKVARFRPTDEIGNYINPWKFQRVKNGNSWGYNYNASNTLYDSFEFGMRAPNESGSSDNQKPYGGYVENDTYNGSTVDSVIITYNAAEKQDNGQLEFLTYGWGWTAFYDGDTVELYCVIEYDYDEKTYKANYVVTRLICDTYNVCPSAFDYDNVIHGFDIDVIIDDIIEVESNELVKVDQYGNGVPGAEFDFYSANPDYSLKSGAPIPALHVKTDENGVFQFTETVTDESGKTKTNILSLRKIKELLGSNHFVMRETSSPPGYRSIPQEAHLFFEGSVDDGGKELFVQCENSFESGVIANADANVIAPQNLVEAGETAGQPGKTIPYYSISNSGDFTFNGDLYAVVLKRNGANPGISDVSQITLKDWSPVYGDDLTGYTVVKPTDGKIAADIVKQLISENKGVYKFEPNITGRFCSTSVSNLPGQLTRYYTYMYNTRDNHQLMQDDLNNLEYIVSYYFVPYDDNNTPNLDGIMRINSHDVSPSSEDQFKIHWATTIEAPNFTNNLYFQKTNANGNLLDDAYFALYNAVEITTQSGETITCLVGENGRYYDLQTPTVANQTVYKGKADEYDSKGYLTATYDYEIDCNPNDGRYEVNGMVDKPYIGQVRIGVNGGTQYINPVPRTDDTTKSFVGYTHSAHTGGENPIDCITASANGGTGHFVRLCEGEYVLMEIKPPAGYNVNPEKVKVKVTEKGVFANAGTKDDGIIVAKGVGYLAETMTSFASRGNINESLTWIAAHLNINNSESYSAVTSNNGWVFASPASETYNGKTNRVYTALYRGEMPTTETRDGAMVTYLVYDPLSQNYTDSTGSITVNRKLFEYAVNLGENPADLPTDVDYEKGQSERTEFKATVNGEDITTRATGEGTGTLRLYTDIGWSFLSVFQDSGYALQNGIRNPTSLYNDLTTNNDRLQYLFSNATYVQVTDPISVELTVSKRGKDPENPDDPSSYKPLPDAQFILYKTVEGKQYFYKLKNGVVQALDSNDVEWTENESTALTMTSESTSDRANALLRIYGLGIGTYTLQEVKAPDGYTCAAPSTIEISIVNGDIVLSFNEKEQNPINNSNPLYDTSLGTAEIKQYAVTIVDDVGLQLNIKKVDADDKSKILPGAEFILYKTVTESDKAVTYYYSLNSSGGVTWVQDESAAAKLTSTGENPISISGIVPGTYYLRETKSPPGYNALTSDVEISVSDENMVTITGGTEVTSERDNTSSNGVIIYSITVPNTTGYALPETGGTGTQIFTYSGIALMLMALTLIAVKAPFMAECARRRSERRAEK